MKKILWLPVLAICLGLLTGCTPRDTNLTDANNGQATTIHVGGRLVIELEANPTTGYTWEVLNLDTSLLVQSGEIEYRSSSLNPMPGQGGTQILRFQAVHPGTTTLQLIYHRPFETNTPPLQTYNLPLTIEP